MTPLILFTCLCICVHSVVAVKPYFPVTENGEVIVHNGQHFGLKCIPEGTPKPTITWDLPKNLTNSLEMKHISYHYNYVELEIKNMVPGLAGTYVCLAHNRDGTASLTYNVRYATGSPTTTSLPMSTTPPLQIKPDVFLKYTERNVTEGDPLLAIPCAADGLPKPNITWTVIGDRMPSNAVQYQQFLIIRNIRLDDSRYYLCTATNSLGSAVKAVHVNVKPRPHVPPKVTLPTNLNGKYGSTVILNCNVTGYPTPTVKWYFNGKVLSETSHQYTIRNATFTEIGAYTCEATNNEGTSKTDVVFIVQGTPPSLIKTPPQSVTATPKIHPTFTCTANGDPKPTISWTFKPFVGTVGNVIKQISTDNTRISLPGINQSGLLKCTATNPFGQVQATSSIIYIPV